MSGFTSLDFQIWVPNHLDLGILFPGKFSKKLMSSCSVKQNRALAYACSDAIEVLLFGCNGKSKTVIKGYWVL